MAAKTTSEIALELLGLLQTHRRWAGPDLARRLGTTPRTLRRHVERLREMGYRVEAERGRYGGYRLVAGSTLPPLLFTDAEAVAVAASLRIAVVQGLVDDRTTSATAIAKFEQLLPARLRPRVAAVAEHSDPIGSGRDALSANDIGIFASACRDREIVTFGYRKPGVEPIERTVEPVALVPSDWAWFVVAWDRHKSDWRTFRVDRTSDVRATGSRFLPREFPAESAAHFVQRALTRVDHAYKAEVILDIRLDDWAAYANGWARGSVAIDDGTTRWPVRAATLQDLMVRLNWIPDTVNYRVETDDTTATGLRRMACRLAGSL